jgi:hypothetical protein
MLTHYASRLESMGSLNCSPRVDSFSFLAPNAELGLAPKTKRKGRKSVKYKDNFEAKKNEMEQW